MSAIRTLSFLNPQRAASIQDTLKGTIQQSTNGLWYISETSKWKSHFAVPFKVGEALKDFTDSTVQNKLELQEMILNWDPKFTKLFPLSTASDNNCLCHGVCYALTGSHDRQYLFRTAIESIMSNDSEACRWFQERWMKSIIAQDVASFGMEIERSEEQWEEEWLEELKLVQDRSKSLTEIHVLVLAHVVRRPIVVYSPSFTKDVDGQPLAPIYFGGIYLPLLWAPSKLLSRTPLLLAYNDSHFTALIPEVTEDGQVPLADKDGEGFPIKFADVSEFPPGSTTWVQKLRQYMDVVTDRGPCVSAVIPKGNQVEFVQDLMEHAKSLGINTSVMQDILPEPVAQYAKVFKAPRKAEAPITGQRTTDVLDELDIPQAQVAAVYVAKSIKAGHISVGKDTQETTPPPSYWTCPTCKLQNLESDGECNICGTPNKVGSGSTIEASRPSAVAPVRPGFREKEDSSPSPVRKVPSKAPASKLAASPLRERRNSGPKGPLFNANAVGSPMSPKAKKSPLNSAMAAAKGKPAAVEAKKTGPPVARGVPSPVRPVSEAGTSIPVRAKAQATPPSTRPKEQAQVRASPAKLQQDSEAPVHTPAFPQPQVARVAPVSASATLTAVDFTPEPVMPVAAATVHVPKAMGARTRQAQQASVSVVTSGKARLSMTSEPPPPAYQPPTPLTREVTGLNQPEFPPTEFLAANNEMMPPPKASEAAAGRAGPPTTPAGGSPKAKPGRSSPPGARPTSTAFVVPKPAAAARGADATELDEAIPMGRTALTKVDVFPATVAAKKAADSPWLSAIERSPRGPVTASSPTARTVNPTPTRQATELPAAEPPPHSAWPMSLESRGSPRAKTGAVRPAWPTGPDSGEPRPLVRTPSNRVTPGPRASAVSPTRQHPAGGATSAWPMAVKPAVGRSSPTSGRAGTATISGPEAGKANVWQLPKPAAAREGFPSGWGAKT